ncbi:MAG: HAMP domain-containing histidine kinase [Myxococcales bacterium]|jgi:signal transduction histidine kinase|nr:HAMP domain-containing histidine kinase [Myxococcales bacterium]
MASSRWQQEERFRTVRDFSALDGGEVVGSGGWASGEHLARIDNLMAMGRQCLCVRDREEGHALLLAHAMDAAEADIGLLFEVSSVGRGRLVAAQGRPHLPALCESLCHQRELPLDIELAALFHEKLQLPRHARFFETPLIGRDGPCGVLVFFWLQSPADESEGIEGTAHDPYLERVAEQCAQCLEHLRICWSLDQALERVEEVTQQQRQQKAFFSAVAHELRSPMNALLGGLQLFAESGRGLTSIETRVGRVIQRALQCQARLIDDLTDLGRLGIDRLSIQMSCCDLTELLSLSLDKLQGEIDASRVQLRADLGPGPLLVEADGDRLAQIFDNLLSNARRHTEEGFIEVSAALESGEAVVRVEDSGGGMAQARLDALFEPFWSAKARFDEQSGGMGIGLSIAHELVVRQKGQLTAASDGIGKGSRFEVRFPLMTPGNDGDRPLE